ncbi:MAG TPA: hypothetical protein VII30_00070 [Gemmatimonadaceae bacterium]
MKVPLAARVRLYRRANRLGWRVAKPDSGALRSINGAATPATTLTRTAAMKAVGSEWPTTGPAIAEPIGIR